MAAVIEFCLLGPLRVRVDGVQVRVPRGKQRVLLAALLLQAGRTVTAGQLAELMWGASLPPSSAATLHNYVKRLREALGPGRDRIVTLPGGYLIRVDPGELDIAVMEEKLAGAHGAARAGAWPDAATQASAALALWRGEPLCDVDLGVVAAQEVARLTELRFQARVLWLEAGLHLGRHAELVAEARQLTVEAPLREQLHALLMRALCQCGRRAEALEAYQVARRVLVDELGCEPGPDLRALHREILEDSPALRPAAPPAGPQVPVPRQLPAPVAGFTGRAAELKTLTQIVGQACAGTPGTVVISAIGGTAGVGKTALAVQLAHRVAGSFPDGQLYVNLRGYDPGQPMSAADALVRFLRDLGVAGPDIPAGEEERAARYRSLLAGQRMLVVLDNAGEEDQVRPLLPGSPGCAAVVTSRDALAGLVARDGARRLDLGLLPLADAVSLLRALIGGRADAEPEAAAALAARCCRLPLALRVAAELAAARPAVPLSSLGGELADQQRRLDLLDAGGDPRTAVSAVFSWSIRHLDPGTARAFRLLGLHTGPDLEACAAAALTGTSLRHARQLLDQLGRKHLIQAAGHSRYAMHDLLRDYARELAAADDGEDEQRAALTRLFDYYLQAAAAAMDTLYPAAQHLRPRIPAAAAIAPPLTQPDEARAWLAAELPSLVAAAVHAAGHGWPGHATNLSATLYRCLAAGGHLSEAVIIHGHACGAARQTGDVAAEAGALTSLGIAELQQGRYQRAAGHLERALGLRRQTGDRGGEARALISLGNVAFRQGRYEQAAGHQQLAMSLCRQAGNRINEAVAMNNLGITEARLGRFQHAAAHLEQALALSRDTGDQDGEARALQGLGEVSLRQGRHEQAADYLQRALALFRDACHRVGEAYAMTSLGGLDLRQGRYQQAARQLQEALTLSRDTGERAAETEALSLLGELSLATGDHEQARIHFAAALALASHTGDTYWQARAFDGLARSHHAEGDPAQARRRWHQALTLYTEMDTPEADQVRAQLASTQRPEPSRTQ